MKYVLTICLVCVALVAGGCDFWSGAATGAVAIETVGQIKGAYEEQINEYVAQIEANLKTLEQTADETERMAIEKQNAVLKEKLEDTQERLFLAEMAEKGIKTDWKNPESVSTYLATVLAGFIAWKVRKKK
jgi:hypothetical protein